MHTPLTQAKVPNKDAVHKRQVLKPEFNQEAPVLPSRPRILNRPLEVPTALAPRPYSSELLGGIFRNLLRPLIKILFLLVPYGYIIVKI